MARLAHLLLAVPAVTIAAYASAGAAAASPFPWFWSAQERPVIYRPVVTPRTYYFAPADRHAMPHRPYQNHHAHRPAR